MAGTRVLLVDDDSLVLEALTRILAEHSDVEVVGQAETGDEAILKVQELKPHVVIMDVRMPKVDGIAAAREIKSKSPEVQILGLTEYAHGYHAEAMLRAGALAVYQKSTAFEELYPAIKKITARQHVH
jgi:two-component system, NarL family, invasion response regulator UvrY